jgi:hypothetical protein
MRSTGRIALAVALTVCDPAYGQTVEAARQQMLMHTGQNAPPTGQGNLPAIKPPPDLLLDPATHDREFQEGLRRRNLGIGLSVAGFALETTALFLVFVGWATAFGEQITNGFCAPDCPPGEADAYFRGALVVGLIGAAALGAGIPTWVGGRRQMRKANGYFVSIVPRVGEGFAGVGATIAF